MKRLKTSSRVSGFGRLLRPKAFWRANEGAAAVEFAMVAVPFLALLGGIIELGLAFMGQVTLDNAMTTASRNIRTGSIQSAANATQQPIQLANFKHDVCNEMAWMISDCESNLKLSVDDYTSFSSVPMTSPISNGHLGVVENFHTGGPGSVVVVRAYYPWTLLMPVLNEALIRADGKALLTSIATFANEPFIADPPTTVTPVS